MTDRPIIFSAPMVRALLDGRKTQTRRVLKPQPKDTGGGWFAIPGGIVNPVRAPLPPLPYTARDRLWVRETWRSTSMRPDDVVYRADAESLMRWRSPIHMPRWASRLTLVVTDVRVQRLHEISGEDAVAEGMASHGPNRPQDDFRDLWNSIHGPDAWDANPWVAAVSFTVECRNIDSFGLVRQ